MPYIGLIPFLRKEENEENFKGTCVNALHRAYPISTFIKFIKGEHFMCVNALHRAYPISTPKMTAMWFMFFTVSMPYIGLIPFLQTEGRRRVY